MRHRAEIVCDARRENLAALLGFVDEASQQSHLSVDVANDVRLATEEACVNVIAYGYPEFEIGPIRLRFECDGKQVTIAVEDEGIAFDPTTISPAKVDLPSEEREIGGLGWHLITQVMDEVHHVRTPDNRNLLTLVKQLPTADAVQET